MEIYEIKVSADVDKAEASVKRLHKKLQDTSHEATRSSDLLKKLDAITLSAIIDQVRGIADGLREMASPAIQFEQSMADLSAITGSVGDELEDLKKTAREVGAESGLGASESARAFTILASQIDVPLDSLKTLQRETILLAQVGALPLETAADALAGTINQFGMEADEASRIVNVLAAASRAGGAEIDDMAESCKVSGAAASAAGVSIEETAGALEILAQNNTKGAEAGTALRNMLIIMQARLGIDISKTGFAGGLRILQEMMDKMGSQTAKTSFLAKAFGRENMVAAQFLLQHVDAVEEMTTAVTGTNSATEQAKIRTATWAHRIEVARAKVADFMITVSEATGGLLPFGAMFTEQLVPLAQLSPLLSGVGNAVKSLGASLKASGMGGVAVVIGAIAGALVVAYQSSEEFRAACDELFATIKGVAGALLSALKPAFGALLDAVKPLLPIIGKLLALLANQLAGIIRQLAPILEPVVRIIVQISSLLAPIIGLIIRIVGSIIGALLPALEPLFKIFADNNPFVKLFGDILNGVATVIETVVGWISKLINGLKELLGLSGDAAELAGQQTSTAAASSAQPQAVYTPPVTPTFDPGSLGASFGASSGESHKKEIHDLKTIEGLQNAISAAQDKLNKAKGQEAIALQKKVNTLQQQLAWMQFSIATAAKEGYPSIQASKAAHLKQVKAKEVRGGNIVAYVLGKEGLGKSLDEFQKKANRITLDHLTGEAQKWQNFVGSIRSGLDSVSSTMSTIGDVVGGAAGSWFKWAGSVVSAIGQAIPQLLALFNANVATASSGAAASQSSIPVVGPMMAVASVASILAAIAHPPKAAAFAEGGILFGPTYALAGEYPGASNNPEVIAPLDRLPSLLGTDKQPTTAGEVSFKIRGRELVGILNKELKTTRLS